MLARCALFLTYSLAAAVPTCPEGSCDARVNSDVAILLQRDVGNDVSQAAEATVFVDQPALVQEEVEATSEEEAERKMFGASVDAVTDGGAGTPESVVLAAWRQEEHKAEVEAEEPQKEKKAETKEPKLEADTEAVNAAHLAALVSEAVQEASNMQKTQMKEGVPEDVSKKAQEELASTMPHSPAPKKNDVEVHHKKPTPPLNLAQSKKTNVAAAAKQRAASEAKRAELAAKVSERSRVYVQAQAAARSKAKVRQEELKARQKSGIETKRLKTKLSKEGDGRSKRQVQQKQKAEKLAKTRENKAKAKIAKDARGKEVKKRALDTAKRRAEEKTKADALKAQKEAKYQATLNEDMVRIRAEWARRAREKEQARDIATES